jgi:hypothetical protein
MAVSTALSNCPGSQITPYALQMDDGSSKYLMMIVPAMRGRCPPGE